MVERTNIRALQAEDHQRLDDLFEAFQEWKERDLTRARVCLARFAAVLRHHFAWEETVLFPLYERETGGTATTEELRVAHREVRAWLKALKRKLDRRNTRTDLEEVMLLEEFLLHNVQEEALLDLALDKHPGDGEEQAALSREAVPAGV